MELVFEPDPDAPVPEGWELLDELFDALCEDLIDARSLGLLDGLLPKCAAADLENPAQSTLGKLRKDLVYLSSSRLAKG